MQSVVGLGGALLFDLAHQPADVLAGVPGQFDDLALPHALPYGLGHGDGQGGTCVVGALLGCGLGAHGLPQCGDGLLGDGHIDMFAHRGGHTKVCPSDSLTILACGHIDVAPWVWRIKGSNRPYLSCPSTLSKDQYMAVSKRLRYEIFRRDSHTCRYCGASAPDVPLRVDHVTPVALGGTDEPGNLVTACEPCNSGKSSSTVDAAVVAEVSDDALRWSAAMQQAAEDLRQQQAPKDEYRDSFRKAWSGWTRENGWKTERVELPDGWKGSLDAFYAAGLPQEVWPDIIEKAMTNPTVRIDNTFRYACGIAWRMVKELHERAREIASPAAKKNASALSPIGQAALDRWAHSWASNLEESPSSEERAAFARSLEQLEADGRWVDPKQLIAAAIFGGSEGDSTIQDAMAGATDQERADIVIEWCDAWTDLDGASPRIEPPDTFLFQVVQNQVDDLADGGVSLDRIRRAALLAGSHHSSELHHGLRPNELEHTGVDAFRHRAVDLWSRSFRAGANRWPEAEERSAFMNHYNRVVADGDFYLNDVLAAAATAGAYQDTDLATCLPRHLSALEIAAQPLGGAV